VRSDTPTNTSGIRREYQRGGFASPLPTSWDVEGPGICTDRSHSRGASNPFGGVESFHLTSRRRAAGNVGRPRQEPSVGAYGCYPVEEGYSFAYSTGRLLDPLSGSQDGFQRVGASQRTPIPSFT